MPNTDFWDKFIVHGYKIGFAYWLLFMLPQSGQAQLFRWARQHNVSYDNQKITYGFSIGLHTSSYQVKYSNKFVSRQLDSVTQVQPIFSPGFSLGFLINYRFNEF